VSRIIDYQVTITLINVFRSIEVDTENYTIDTSNPKWYHYFLCGYRGLLEHIGSTGSISFDVLLDGTIPRCAGLSSSSALVCCAALVTMHLYSVQLSRVCNNIDLTKQTEDSIVN
jgi:N-acetylgalactosamine kinase